MTDLPEQTAVPGEPLPSLPDSAYPEDAQPLEVELLPHLPFVLVQVTGVSDDDEVSLSVKARGLPEPEDIAGILGLALSGLARDGSPTARGLLQPDAWQS